MKKTALFLFALSLVGTLTSRADPMLTVQVTQTGNDVALNWCVADPGENSMGLVLYIEGMNQLGQDSYNFLGWWNANTGALNGDMQHGWTDFPTNGLSDGQGYVPYPSGRFAGIFSEGIHGVVGYFLPEGSTLPYGYSPDGQYGGSGGTWLNASYGVSAPVPEHGATVLMMVGGFAVVGLLRVKRLRSAGSLVTDR